MDLDAVALRALSLSLPTLDHLLATWRQATSGMSGHAAACPMDWLDKRLQMGVDRNIRW